VTEKETKCAGWLWATETC